MDKNNKKFDNNAQSIISERGFKQTIMCQEKKKKRRLASIEDCVNTEIRGLEDDIKKNKEILITTVTT